MDLDGQAHRVTCFAIPVGVGFEPIESLFQGLEAEHPELSWYFTNVYTDEGGTVPLAWWVKQG